MNKKQASAIAEISNASYMVMADHPKAETLGCSQIDANKVITAQRELGYKILAKYGLSRAFGDVYRYVMEQSV